MDLNIQPIKAGTAVPFAGRVGGNQTFVARESDPASQQQVKDTPDAVPLHDLRAAFHLGGFAQPIIWKAAIIEGWAVSMLVFVNGSISSALGQYAASSPLAVAFGGAFWNWIAITMFVYAAAPASGGHLNPLITLSTFTAGLSTLPRTVLYVVAQAIGAVIGAFLLKLGLGGPNYFPTNIITGCTIDSNVLSYGQAYILETGSSLAAIFLAFGVGLDPRQGQVFGSAYSPVLVGLSVGFVDFGSTIVRKGWYGASLNPARCFGLMSANLRLNPNWIHWLAAVTAACFNGIFYALIPPYHSQL